MQYTWDFARYIICLLIIFIKKFKSLTKKKKKIKEKKSSLNIKT